MANCLEGFHRQQRPARTSLGSLDKFRDPNSWLIDLLKNGFDYTDLQGIGLPQDWPWDQRS